MDIFQSLLEIDKTLVGWIVNSSPDNDDQRQQIVEVLAAKSDVDKAIDSLVSYRLKLASSTLNDDAAQLGRISRGMAEVDQDISKIQKIIDYAGQAVSLASDIAQKVIAF